MRSPEKVVAQQLLSSARTLAGYAAAALAEQHPDTLTKFGGDAFGAWKESFVHRIDELVSAMEMNRPALFLSQIRWTQSAYEKRGVPVFDLRRSLEVLREVLLEQIPGEAGAPAARLLDEAIEMLGKPAEHDGALVPSNEDGLLALRYIEALLEGDRQRAIDLIVERVDSGARVHEVVMNVLAPAQHELGRMWHAGDLGVAEEHFSTGVTQAVMSILSQKIDRAEPNGKTALLATAQGDTHDMGLRVLDLLLQEAGWRTILLGADTPAREVSEGISVFGADVMIISASMPTQLRTLRSSIATLREMHPRVKVLVGGRVFKEDPGLGEEMGADACAIDPEGAVALAGKLVGLA